MWMTCWQCGQEIWLETQRECRHCYHAAHRCADCDHYHAADSVCRLLDVPIPSHEAEAPTRLALSFNCKDWRPSAPALARAPGTIVVAVEEAPATEVAATPVPPATPAPASLDDVEVITIPREPPLREPKHSLIIAHRGAPVAAPENTLASFQAALDEGAQAIELDVHLTSDSQPVVIHDATVDRCSDGKGPVTGMTLAEVKALDAGNWFDPAFAGERIPTLDEALAAIPHPTLMIVHLRAHENTSDRCERAVVEAIERRDARKRCIVSHHTRHGLHRLRELDPHLRLCWLPYGGEPGLEYIDDAYYMGYRIIQPSLREVNEEFVRYAHDKQMWINVFWADEVADMERMVDLRVQGILTNFPERLRAVLKHKAS
jgi:glycerophosphoryl diester phosphodiesterase